MTTETIPTTTETPATEGASAPFTSPVRGTKAKPAPSAPTKDRAAKPSKKTDDDADDLIRRARESGDDKAGALADALQAALDEGDEATRKQAATDLTARLAAFAERKAKRG